MNLAFLIINIPVYKNKTILLKDVKQNILNILKKYCKYNSKFIFWKSQASNHK